jgi:hypothetical protein
MIIVIIMVLSMSIATASIAMECYNKNPKFEQSTDTTKTNKDYLKFALWTPVSVLGMFILYLLFKMIGPLGV